MSGSIGALQLLGCADMERDPGDKTRPRKAPTMDDVALEAGVSRALVSLVMRGASNVSDHRRTAVLAAAEHLGYRPNAVARSLAEKRSHTFGVVLDDLHNTFFADLLDGIHEIANKHNYRLLLNTAWLQQEDERQAIESFLQYRVDGIILLSSRTTRETVAEANRTTPVVRVGNRMDGIDTVVNDDERGAELAVEHLIDLGHTDIVHITGEGGSAQQREDGFARAMQKHGLTPRLVEGDFSERAGAEAVELMLAERTIPTAIFAANDLMAVAALDRLQQAELRVPEDVNVVGYDNTSLASLRHVSLTTINQPRVEIGRLAAQCLVERLDEGRDAPVSHVVSPDLIIRRTTGPSPQRRLSATPPPYPNRPPT